MRLLIMSQGEDGWLVFGSLMDHMSTRPGIKIEHYDATSPLIEPQPSDVLVLVESIDSQFQLYHERYAEAIEAYLPVVLINISCDRLSLPIGKAQIISWDNNRPPIEPLLPRLNKIPRATGRIFR